MPKGSSTTKGRRYSGPANRPEHDRVVTRRQLADHVGMHQDSLSRLLSAGLGAAVVEWGGRGQEQRFSLWMALRFLLAHRCRSSGRICSSCTWVLADSEALAAHLLDARHGVFEPCDDDDMYQGDACLPCRPISL